MHRLRFPDCRGLLLLCVVASAGLPACDRGGTGGGTLSRAPRNVLLITIDAARADRLGCYGNADAKTPALDALAHSGVLFKRAYAQAPITLPSHTVLFTGRYPRETGIRDNYCAALAPDQLTLATLAKQARMKTAAFVSNLALDERFGLARGFDTYDDDVERQTADAEAVAHERSAPETTNLALAWLKIAAASGDPFFCWVHFSDPRPPHEPPPEFRADAKDPYDGELALVDSQLQRLIVWLNDANLAGDTVIIVLGAHGEALGDDAAAGHALLLQESNIRVPWLVVFRDVLPAGRRIGGAVELASLFPTVCGLMSWQAPAEVTAPSLVGSLVGAGEPQTDACYVESCRGFVSHRWAEQRALIEGKWKYVSSTRPELFDLSQDALGLNNVIAAHAEVAADLDRKLRARYAGTPTGVPASPSSRPTTGPAADGVSAQRTGDEFLTAGAPDPKDMLGLLERTQRLARLLKEGKLDEAIALLEQAVSASPGSPAFQRALGAVCTDAGRVDMAVNALDRAVQIAPRDPQILTSMGDALLLAGNRSKAADFYTTALIYDPTDVQTHVKLARVAIDLDRSDVAASEFQSALQLFPGHVDAAMELVALLERFGRTREIIPFFEDLARRHPRDAGAEFGVGLALAACERYDEAMARFRAALALDPGFGHAYNKLGICAARLKRTDEALANFQKAKSYAMSRPEGWFNTGVAMSQMGRNAEAIEAYEQALVNRPAYPSAISALTRQYGAARDVKNVLRVLRAAVTTCPTDVRVHTTLAEVLSTCNDASLRNGEEALLHARRAIELVGGRDHPELLQTLATALAETGDFAGAKAAATKARQLALQSGDRKLAEAIAAQLAGYERRQPYRGSAY